MVTGIGWRSGLLPLIVLSTTTAGCAGFSLLPSGEKDWTSREPTSISSTGEIAGKLVSGRRYYSPRRAFFLSLESDGNLVLRAANGDFIWGLNKQTPRFFRAVLVDTSSGNLVARNDQGEIIWSALSQIEDLSARLIVTDLGSLRIVSRDGTVRWSSDANLAKSIDPFAITSLVRCKPDPGWSKCLEMVRPTMRINGTARTSYGAMRGVAAVYSAMFESLNPDFDPAGFNGFRIYLTNGEPYSQIKLLKPIGNVLPDNDTVNGGDFLRGYAAPNHLWISEQMICKTGVATRKAAGWADDSWRSFDQAIHEMAHAMESGRRYVELRKQNDVVFANHAATREEGFALAVQAWFGSGGMMSDVEERHLSANVFRNRVVFSCDQYLAGLNRPRLAGGTNS